MLDPSVSSSSTLTTPTKPTPTRSRSRSSTTTTNPNPTQLISPSLLRIASSSSTTTVRVSKSFAGQSGLREDDQSGKNEEDDPDSRLGLPGPSRTSSRSRSRSGSRTPSRVECDSGSSLIVPSNQGSRTSSSPNTPPHRACSPLNGVNLDAGRTPKVRTEGDARVGLKRLITSSNVLVSTSASALTSTNTSSIMAIRNGSGTTKSDEPLLGLGPSVVGPITQEIIPDKKGKRREDSFSRRRYHILTNAGKPVFDSLEAEGDETTNMMGVIQAIISIFTEMGDQLRSLKRGRHKVHFLLRSPVFLFVTSDWGEPDFVLRMHLEHLHLQVLSIVTEVQLKKVFQRQSNFDLRRLLEGTEPSLHTLLDDLQTDLTFMTSALQPMRLAPALRDAAGQVLAPHDKIKDLLYVLLLVNDKVVTLLRPRKHSIHPTDLHLLMNVLRSSPGLKSSETWLPLCLPKFNPNGFVYALIDYVKENIGLVFVSADREGFEQLQGWKRRVVRKLEDEHILGRLELAALADPYLSIEAGYPGLRHFWYKSRQNVQVTMPIWESPYDEMGDDRRRLITVYQRLYDAIHARSGQAHTLKQHYIRSESEACLAWITPGFELYVCVEPHLPKSGAVAAANAVARWVRKQESWMFLKEAPVF